MRHLVFIAGLMLVFSMPACAQSYPGGEIFTGFSYSTAQVSARDNYFGWQISFGINPRRYVRLVGDFGGQYRESGIVFQGQTATLRNYQLLWGPEFTRRNSRATLFGHTLFGVAATHLTTPSGDPAHPQNVISINYGFAMGFGGGVDLNVGNHLAIRVFQADYIPTHLKPEPLLVVQLPPSGSWQHNFRVGVGVVLKIGKRT